MRSPVAVAFAVPALLPFCGAVNMNGMYRVASKDAIVEFNTDFASKGDEFFEVYSPEIATHYGEVFWTELHNIDLPADIVSRFKGKAIALTGYESDQVMVIPTGKPGANPEKDVSVPINWAYNHHYQGNHMTGSHSEMRRVPRDPEDTSAHGSKTMWAALPTASGERMLRANPDIPVAQVFGEGNGGEYRKSFHGYPKGYAQLIDSPDKWHLTPMQIDTRNRDCGVSPADVGNCTRFTPGPEPRQARYGLGVNELGQPIATHGTNYSGLLECPCNSRFGGDPAFYPGTKTKHEVHDYKAQATAACDAASAVKSPGNCFAAAVAIGISPAQAGSNRTVESAQVPHGCSLTLDQSGKVDVTFNTGRSSVPCSVSERRTGAAQTAAGVAVSVLLDPAAGPVTFNHSGKGVYCTANRDRKSIIGTFPMAAAGAVAALHALSACEDACTADPLCTVCSVDCTDCKDGIAQWLALPTCGPTKAWAGMIPGDVSRKQYGEATINVTGPADVWFGVGFNAQHMTDAPYTLIVNESGVIEQQIGTCGSEAEHCAGTQLSSSVTVSSNTVANGRRTVVMARQFVGLTPAHYSFGAGGPTIRIITAVGAGPVFSYHKAHAAGVVTVLAGDGAPTCVCDEGVVDQLCNGDGSGCTEFVKSCVAAPAGSLLEQHNPTCNSGQYAGGLRCCGHRRIMLDADQEIRPELLRYHLKFRFWFQEYRVVNGVPSHINLPRVYQQTEANAGEYDVPPAFRTPGVPIPGYPDWPQDKMTPGTACTGTCPGGADCSCVHTIHYKWKVGPLRLIYAGGHCHAPSCIDISLYRNDTGELLCHQTSEYGAGNTHLDKFDEAGYLVLPPCLWGNASENLSPSVLLPAGTPLLSIKRNVNTHMGHFGEMASWQMRGVTF